MNEQPSPTENNGRDPAGRFAHGNKLAKGNPHGKRVNELRAALLEAVDDATWRGIVGKLVELALAGEKWAVEEVLNRTLGRPLEADLLDRIEQLEAMLAEEGKP